LATLQLGHSVVSVLTHKCKQNRDFYDDKGHNAALTTIANHSCVKLHKWKLTTAFKTAQLLNIIIVFVQSNSVMSLQCLYLTI